MKEPLRAGGPRGGREELVGRVEELERAMKELHRTRDLLMASEETERKLAGQLASLVEISAGLSRAATVEELFRRAVELGRDLLAFDRLGIWLRTDDPAVIAGTFGVDEKGAVCDERSVTVRLDPGSPDGRILLGRQHFSLAGEGPVVNSLGEIVGRASQLFAALWDGEKVIGHVSADNRIGHRPIIVHQIGLLRLFGMVVGTLYMRQVAQSERDALVGKLQRALSEIKTLHGFIPICAQCKKVRDDKGYWRQIEAYISEHSDADFSHGLCPDCLGRLYPDWSEEGDPTP